MKADDNLIFTPAVKKSVFLSINLIIGVKYSQSKFCATEFHIFSCMPWMDRFLSFLVKYTRNLPFI